MLNTVYETRELSLTQLEARRLLKLATELDGIATGSPLEQKMYEEILGISACSRIEYCQLLRQILDGRSKLSVAEVVEYLASRR